jgi:hypothetical protein
MNKKIQSNKLATLLEFTVSLNEEGNIEVSKTSLSPENWDIVVKKYYPAYDNKIIISNFLEYLKNSTTELEKALRNYF